MLHNLFVDLVEGVQRAEGNLHEQSLALVAVLLLVLNQAGTVDEDLGEVFFQVGVVHFQLVEALGNFVFQVGGLALQEGG